MSGGPIFNGSTGGVCGVICDSFGENPDGSEHTSFGSLIWPSLAIQMETLIENKPPLVKISFFEAIEKNYIKADKTFKNLKFQKKGDKISVELLNSG